MENPDYEAQFMNNSRKMNTSQNSDGLVQMHIEQNYRGSLNQGSMESAVNVANEYDDQNS